MTAADQIRAALDKIPLADDDAVIRLISEVLVLLDTLEAENIRLKGEVADLETIIRNQDRAEAEHADKVCFSRDEADMLRNSVSPYTAVRALLDERLREKP